MTTQENNAKDYLISHCTHEKIKYNLAFTENPQAQIQPSTTNPTTPMSKKWLLLDSIYMQ